MSREDDEENQRTMRFIPEQRWSQTEEGIRALLARAEGGRGETRQ